MVWAEPTTTRDCDNCRTGYEVPASYPDAYPRFRYCSAACFQAHYLKGPS